jgi:uncharacterized membrane protein
MIETILACLGGALRWYAVALLFCLPAAPLFLAALPSTVGWGVARCLGPQLIAWVALLPALGRGGTAFTPGRLALAAIATFAVSALLAALITGPKRLHRSRPTGRSFRNLLAFEALLLGTFLALAVAVSFCVSLGANDGMTDAGFFIAILRQRVFPIEDPGLAGFTLHYYLFGFYAKAAVAFFTGLTPLDNYRMAVAATASAQIAGIALFLRAFNWTWRHSALGALALGCCSNLESLLRTLARVSMGVPFNTGQVVGWLWDDYSTGGFLISGFESGILHSTILSYSLEPVFFCLCALVLFSSVVEQNRKDWVLVCLGGLMAAWAKASNTWEVPLYLGLPVLCFLMTYRMRPHRQTALLIASFALVFVLACQPFAALSHAVPISLGWDVVHTPLTVLLRHWGTFFLPLAIWLIAKLFTPQRRRYFAPLVMVGLSVALNDSVWMIGALLVLSAVEMRAVDLKVRTVFALVFTCMAMMLVLEFVYVRNTTPLRFNTLTHVNPMIWNLLSVAMLVLVTDWVSRLPRWRVAAWSLCAMMLFPYYVVFAAKSRMSTQDTRSGLATIAAQSEQDAALVEWVQSQGLSGVVLEAALHEYDDLLPARLSAPSGLRSYLGYSSHAYHLILYGGHPEIVRRGAWVKSLEDGSWYGGGDTCSTLKKVLALKKIDYVALGSVERKKFSSSFRSAVEDCLHPVHGRDLFAGAEHLGR